MQAQEQSQARAQRKERTGLVVSNKMNKTITVAVERLVPHKLYKKAIRRTVKYHAHDEENSANIGDLVRIRETRPLSKSKRWRLIEVVKRAE
ncbi:MAG: 30S ribosomal protein S17 [Candidatus Hydrogenedentales bacterium]